MTEKDIFALAYEGEDLNKMTDVNQKSEDGRSIIHHAITGCQYPTVEHLIRLDADLDTVDDLGFTPLHTAAAIGRIEFISLILKHAPSLLNKPNRVNGNTAVHYAASKGRMEALKFLIDARADINQRNRLRQTALHRPSIAGKTQVVSLLLESGAAVDATDAEGNTSLYLALDDSQLEVAKLLLRAGASTDLVNNESKTAIDFCRTPEARALISS